MTTSTPLRAALAACRDERLVGFEGHAFLISTARSERLLRRARELLKVLHEDANHGIGKDHGNIFIPEFNGRKHRRTAALTAAPFTMLASTPREQALQGAAIPRHIHPANPCAPAGRSYASGPTSTAKETGGMASASAQSWRTHSNSYIPCRMPAVLLNESHLVNFFHRRDARTNLG